MGIIERLIGRNRPERQLSSIVGRARKVLAVVPEASRREISSRMDEIMEKLNECGKIKSAVQLTARMVAFAQAIALLTWRTAGDCYSRDDCIRIAHAFIVIDLFENYRDLGPDNIPGDLFRQAIVDEALLTQISVSLNLCFMNQEKAASAALEKVTRISALTTDEEIHRAQEGLLQNLQQFFAENSGE